MANDNSDYNLPRTKLHELLAHPFDSNVNKSVFENLFNRFLTKPETRKLAGYIGQGNEDALISRQIVEPTIDRQAAQLQPILFNKIGSVEHMASWKDILNELVRLGVDIDRLPEWGEAQVFNWVPPIDIDKLIHYQDYYWVDPNNPAGQPQYLTIRSRCATATSQANFHQRLVDEFGEDFPISGTEAVDGVLPTFAILSISTGAESILVAGDATADLTFEQFFNVTGTLFNNGEYQILSVPVFDGTNTTFDVGPGILVADELTIGTVNVQRFDTLIIPGEFIRLLEPGFVFFFKNTTNVDLEDSFLTVVSASYDQTADVTTIEIDVTFTSSSTDGDISLVEQLNIFLAEQSCQCEGSVGWDIFSWDDNPTDPLWDGDLVPLLASISNLVDPVAPGAEGELWFNTDTDQLFIYGADAFGPGVPGWKVIYNKFSTVVSATEGLGLWDFTPDCGVQSIIDAADQWIDQNKWVHKTDVTNFSVAKQASLPIIEYDWDLELNEWTFANPVWKYRFERFIPFAATTAQPQLIELTPLFDWVQGGLGFEANIILDDQYGDLTESFTPGSFFQTLDTSDLLEVVSSKFEQPAAGQPFQTIITLTVDVPVGMIGAGALRPDGVAGLRPFRTSLGDPWKAYHDHWLFVETESTIAINHQPVNPFIAAPISSPVVDIEFETLGAGTDGEYQTTAFSQTFNVLTPTPLTKFKLAPTLTTNALVGFDDIRVYVNDIRVFGTYQELTPDGPVAEVDLITTISEDVFYVQQIEFLVGFETKQFDVIRIEVGEGAIDEIGLASVPVRTIEDNDAFNNLSTGGTRTVSLIQLRKAEQVKTLNNQYPLFDIYDTTGASALKANSIFAFATSPDANINVAVGLRIVVDDAGTDFSFEQFLCDPDTNVLRAYRDYSNEPGTYWADSEAREVKFWDGLTWSDKGLQGLQYEQAVVDVFEPTSPFTGQVWFDTISNELKVYDGANFVVALASDVNYLNYDITLQTIWKKGLNDETYVPVVVDWKNRTVEEYDAEQVLFVSESAEELILADPTLTLAEATAQATTTWYASQANDLSPTGFWSGDWEIPDPLYFNNQHENRKILMTSELVSHFNSIISAQPTIPGFIGPDSARFHLIATENVNYGVGGLIKEFNNGFDTFLSSIFVNNVTPPTLFEFAHDQYETLLNVLKEDFRNDANDLMTNITVESLTDFSTFATNTILDAFEQNDNAAFLYGDSTTFTDVTGADDLGVRNWIATLPYLNLVNRVAPEKIVDDLHDINNITHHDGHSQGYAYTDATLAGIARIVINTPDSRSTLAAPDNTFGKIDSGSPPDDIVEFATAPFFGETILGREGVYWYQVVGVTRRLYRLAIAAVGTSEPSSSLADGTLWMDMAPLGEVLRVKNGVTWDVVSGLAIGDGRLHNGTNPADITTSSISAWQELDLDEILVNIILELEERLYENAPTPVVLDYDFDALQDTAAKVALYNQLLENAFLAFTRSSEITAPLVNGDYVPTDPFTWNYKRSVPGANFQIIDTDTVANTFTIDDTFAVSFPAASTFFVKNSGVNDGEFTVVSSVEVAGPQTVITVVETVQDSLLGVIYKGTLPSPDNTGSESGGDWRDYYKKLYGTPYPHLEPWILQGYTDKPTWWEAEYTNDDISIWGNRRWKYLHQTVIEGQSQFLYTGFGDNGTFVAGDGAGGTAYAPGDTITLSDGSIVTVNIIDGDGDVVFFDVTTSSGIIVVPGTTLTQVSTSGTGLAFTLTPELSNIIGVGMWQNIRAGIIPAGQLLPDGATTSTGVFIPGSVPLYNYFSVNIADVTVTSNGGATTFDPDDVFPPFFDYLAAGEPAITLNRSVFREFAIEIISPAADYAFADAGPVEFEWRESSHFLYDQLTIAFQMDPVNLVSDTFGFDYNVIDRLEIDSQTEQTPCHCRTDFHGEVVDDELYQVDGTNQWYVNFNRYLGFDSSLSDFRSLWTLWTAPMMYQFSSFVDTSSLQVAHRSVPTSEFDFRVASKRSPGADDFWLDALDVTLINIPPNLARYDNQLDWGLEVDTNSPLNRSVEYYDVRNFQFDVDAATDVCTLYSYPIQGLEFFNETFFVTGNQVGIFPFARTFDIVGSTGNDGSYTVVSSVYDATVNQTLIEINVPIPSAVVDGNIVANYRSIPWETGDSVWFSTEETLPAPLKGDQKQIGPTRYFIIRLNNNQFQIALTQSNALAGLEIDLTTTGTKNSFVGQISTTFQALDGSRTETLWRHYVIDKTNTLTFTPPFDIQGMQTLVNIVDGYESFSFDEGFRINENKTRQDPDTGRFVDWQIETERFIHFAYGQRLQRNRNINNRYSVSVDVGSNVWTYTAENGTFVTGAPINAISSNTIQPAPIITNIKYFIIVDTASTFRLATTRANAEAGVEIDITSDLAIGDLFITSAADFRAVLPSQEINPFKNDLFFRPAAGIVSNLLTGPSEDIRNTQLLFDQYGRPLNRKQMRILREDQQTQITIIDEINNDVELTSIFNDPYNFIHLGGAHIFIDAYEHVLIFNNYTTEDSLLYDTFLGLNVSKFEMLFNRQVEFTQRPNVGGSYFKTFFNQGAELLDNFETQIDSVRNLYDSFRVIEAKPLIQEARKALGYEGTRGYLDNMNLNEKSQFLFWKALIQHKGSQQSIDAFINSRRFIDAKVDEFWAYKIADFGSSQDKEYPEMFLNTTDAQTSDLRLQFIEEDDFCIPGFGNDGFDEELCGFDISQEDSIALDPGFIGILLTDQERWFNQPDQLEVLRNNGLSLYFDLKPTNRLPIVVTETIPVGLAAGDGWLDISVKQLQLQDESFYDGVIPNGSFVGGDGVGGTAYSAFDTITLSNGTVLTVDTVDGGGDVTGFTIATAGASLDHLSLIGVTLTQTSTSGTGTSFTLIPGAANVTTAEYTFNVFDPDAGFVFSGFWLNTELPILRHNFSSDNEVVTVETVIEGTRIAPTITPGIKSVILSELYIPFTNHIHVFRNGTELEPLVEYVETVDALSNTFSNEIVMVEPLLAGDVVEIVFRSATLLINTHFERVSSNTIRLLTNDIVDNAISMSVWGEVVNESAQSPAKIIDKEAGVVISPVQIWDPARDFQYKTPLKDIELIKDDDPAVYTNTIETDQTPPGSVVRPYILYNTPWNQIEVGTTWLDSFDLDYTSYYDENAITDLDDRLRIWGTLAGWGGLKIYEWIESNVLPEEYDALAIVEEGDRDIEEHLRKAGRARQTVFEFSNALDITSVTVAPTNEIKVAGDQTADYIAGLTVYIIGSTGNNGTFTLSVDSTFAAGETTITTTEDITNATVDGSIFFEWVLHRNKHQEFDVVIEGTETAPGTFEFTLVLDPEQIDLGDLVNVYVNGRLILPDQIVTAPMVVTDLKEADRVRFVKLALTDQVDLDAGIAAGTHDQVYEYTEVPIFDEFGIQQTIYYFWVEEKSTRNKTQEISPKDAQTQLITIPQPYMLTLKPKPADVRTNGVLVDLDRSWEHVIVAEDLIHFAELGRQILLVGSAIKEGDIANLTVTVNGTALVSTTEYTINETGREVQIVKEHLFVGQSELNYDGTLPNGDFVGGDGPGGTAYVPGDTITLDDGSVITVDVVNVNGDVIEFTVTTSGGITVIQGTPLFQASTSGTGTGFSLTPELNNVAGIVFVELDEVGFDYTTEVPTEVFHFPDRHTEAVIRGLRGLITNDRRYTLRFTRDFTLRDDLEQGDSSLELKQHHEEWQLIRQEQPFLVPRALWDKVTESMVGFLLTDPTTRVPTLERELYDTSFSTETRFGLRSGQAFTDGPTALQTILADLNNPDNAFPAVDINAFFAQNDFTTTDGIIAAMNSIYTLFTFTDVNRIYFATLHDAFSFKKEYPDIFKTSMVAIHGIRPFQVAGLFDD